MDFIVNNYQWVFSGIGVVVITLIIGATSRKSKPKHTSNSNVIVNTINLPPKDKEHTTHQINSIVAPQDKKKSSTKILFIDDDTKFKVVKIIRDSGWTNTSIIKDVNNLDDANVKDVDIFFIDINGVGAKLGFVDEGLGLASAIKDKYPDKKVVIYSAESSGNMFHDALKKADDSITKNAEPYQFIKVIEDLSR